MSDGARATVERLLHDADVRIGGDRPQDIAVRDARFYRRVLTQGSLGLGESYMDAWWEAGELDRFLQHLLQARLDRRVAITPRLIGYWLRGQLVNLQSRSRAHIIGERHYDTGNALFEHMLDRRLTYSCGYWRTADNLDQAQEAKLDLICRKLGLEPGMRLLDIGCGWGSLVGYAAEHYGVEAEGVTVSREQVEFARQRYRGLPVRIHLQDYRALEGQYDRVASVGMVEHVGWRNYAAFMRTAWDRLEAGGRFVLHTIGSTASRRNNDPWIEKYIFPNSMLPSVAQLARAAEPDFLLEDLHNFGPDYDPTLMAWDANFRAAWPELASRYGERFYRMWRFYLMASAAHFRTRRLQLWQFLFSKPPQPRVPETVR